jgi:hypothetical protein
VLVSPGKGYWEWYGWPQALNGNCLRERALREALRRYPRERTCSGWCRPVVSDKCRLFFSLNPALQVNKIKPLTPAAHISARLLRL